jgi:NADPH:quinone reductase-like Zn-dependent oxidoreductase
MKAVGYFEPLPISHDNALMDLDIPPPVAGPRGLLVRVRAVSVRVFYAGSIARPGTNAELHAVDERIAGRIRSTASAHYRVLSAANLRRAHALIESGRAQGKLVLSGYV